jgi:hypothetical protein
MATMPLGFCVFLLNVHKKTAWITTLKCIHNGSKKQTKEVHSIDAAVA